MFEKFEINFSLAVSAIGLAILMALVVARAANSEEGVPLWHTTLSEVVAK